MTRNPLREAEENNFLGTGSLTDAEVAEFTATVDYLRAVIPAVFGMDWNDRWAWNTHPKSELKVVELRHRRPDLTVVRLQTHSEVEQWIAGPLRSAARL